LNKFYQYLNFVVFECGFDLYRSNLTVGLYIKLINKGFLLLKKNQQLTTFVKN